MKFNMPPKELPEVCDEVAVGNVYACKGGGKTKFWIVMAVNQNSVNLVGINGDGAITSTANYGVHVFQSSRQGRDLLGVCEDLKAMEFNIAWNIP